MAEMCGPSNGLSTFQKHTTLDRTLQQDRLISRQSLSQGFRSNGPNARNLDPEFAAFQSGNAFDPQEFQQSAFFPPQALQTPAPGPANWASDFQRMNISSAQQPTHHGFGGQAQLNVNRGVGWNQEFARQQTGGPSISQQQNAGSSIYQQPQQLSGNFATVWDDPNYMMSMNSTQATAYSAIGAGPTFQAELPVEAQRQFEDEAFERAFEEAAKATAQSEETSQGQTTTQTQKDQEPLSQQPIENLQLDQPLLGADTIHDPSKPIEKEPQPEDPNALARTAQQLIYNLSGDTRSKMQGSEFMKMMRGFADGSQVVKGDDVVLIDETKERERVKRGEEGNLKVV